MVEKLLVVCVCAAVVLAAGMAFAGVPCAGTSDCILRVLHSGTTTCSITEGAFCPAGDGDTVHVTVAIKDCYGNMLADRDVTINPPGGDFFCEAPKQVTTDALGEASTYFTQFGGCGYVQFWAACEGVVIQGNLVHFASYDNDQPADGWVSVTDFARFASHYLTANPCSDYDCSGSVDITDFAMFASHYQHEGP